VLALALISIPWMLDPRHWHDLFSPRGYRVVQAWMLGFFTVVVSLATDQLVVLIGMHVLWVWGSARLLALLAERSPKQAASTLTV
jgi:hypothetical protein